MNVSILICAHGDPLWEELAWSRAYPSTIGQPAVETLVVYRADRSLAAVRNIAAEEARGEWLCFLDADDELQYEYIGRMAAAALLAPRPALLVPAVQYVTIGHRGSESRPRIPDWGRPLIDINCGVIGTLVPRALFREVGGFRELPMYEDWDLWLRCVAAGAHLLPVPKAVYRAHRGRGRNQQPTVAQEAYATIRGLYEHIPALHQPPKEP